MADVVRISCDGAWTYVLANSPGHVHAQRFARQELGRAGPAEVRLKSEAGPLFWELIQHNPRQHADVPTDIVASLADDAVFLNSGEAVRFGKKSDKYNEFADLSWEQDVARDQGTCISNHKMAEGDIVIVAFPSKKRLLPAQVIEAKNGFTLELVEAVPDRERGFVFDEHEHGLMTASMPSDGTEILDLVPTLSFSSWLFALGSKAMHAPEFEVADRGSKFLVTDLKTGDAYLGQYASKNTEVELENIRCLLSHEGLGGILPRYVLENT